MYGRVEPEFQANALSCDTHLHTPAHLGQGVPVFDYDRYSWTSIRTDVFDICIDWPQGAHSLKSDVLLEKWYQLYWLVTWSAFFHKWCELQHRERKTWRGIVVVHLLQKCTHKIHLHDESLKRHGILVCACITLESSLNDAWSCARKYAWNKDWAYALNLCVRLCLNCAFSSALEIFDPSTHDSSGAFQ